MLAKIVSTINHFLPECKLRRELHLRYSTLSNDTLSTVCHKALDYVERLRLSGEPYGRYLYKEGGHPPILYASLFAALLRQVLGDLEQLTSKQRKEWRDYINSHQRQDGLFRDDLVANEIAETEDWWGWRHLTLLALMALKALKGKPCYPLRFLEAVSSADKVRSWLDNLDWGSRVSYTSNAVQNFGAAMQYNRDILGDSSLDDAIEELLARVAERCNPKTGLWGDGISDPSVALSEGVQAGYHFWLLYWYEGHDIPHAEKALEAIIGLQNRLGGFNLKQINSSACEDIDALDPLVRLVLRYPDVYPPALEVVRKGLRWVIHSFNPDGGACFRRNSAFHYGHDLMFSAVDESSIFATWFRMLTTAFCCELLNNEVSDLAHIDFFYLDCPGYQFSPHHKLHRKARDGSTY